MDCRILKVHNDGTAVVETRGLYRIVLSDGEVADELVTRAEAKAFVDTFNRCHPSGKFSAKAVPYSKV